MFNPQVRISRHLIGCFENIASKTALIKQAGLKFPLKAGLERDFLNRSVHSSTWIEGNKLTLAQVEALSINKNIIAGEKQKKEVQNCLRALRWILKNKNKPLTEKRLLKAHYFMAKGLLSADACGKYRKIQNYIVNAKNIRVFTPPAPSQVSARMHDLFAWLRHSQKEHPIVQSAIFHHEFVTIHPFVDGNGRVARSASQWLLFNKGYESVLTLGLDEFFANDRSRYYNMIQQARELDGDYTYWAEYVAEGLLYAVSQVAEGLKERTLRAKGKKFDLTAKQEEVLKLISERGFLGSAQICKIMNINRSRANQLIRPLLDAGLVVRDGKTRGARYRVG